MRHVNIPVFIPHMGCPNLCVFCNQRTISGTCFFCEDNVKKIIDEALLTAGDAECEIAYFGGSFTGIDRDLMIRLLYTAEGYVKSGKVCGIRLSTRPDYINEDIITILKEYTISEVELGIQSTSDRVLFASRRGHTFSDTQRAVRLLRDAGFRVVGQMMIGLPASSYDDEVMTAKAICDMGCVGSRIYPTIVFRNTELYDMTCRGEYTPLSVEDAVKRSADALSVFEERGVKCLRIGLCESENLHSEDSYAAGPNHSAIGELVMSRLFYERICALLEKEKNAKNAGTLVIECPKGAVSKVSGNRHQNKTKISYAFGIKKIKIIENEELLGYNIKIRLEK